MRSERLRRLVTPLVILLVVAGIVGAVISQRGDFERADFRFSPGLFALGMAAFILYEVMLFGVWIAIVRPLGVHFPLRRQARIWTSSLLARYVPTSALMVVVRVARYEDEGVPRRTTLLATGYELLLQVIVAVVVSSYWMLKLPQLEQHSSRWILLAVPVLGLAALHPRVLGAGMDIVMRRLGREGTTQTLPVRRVLLAAALYALCFLVASVALLAVTAGLHHVSAGDVPLVMASIAIAYVVAVLAFVLPAGLGARESGLATALLPAVPLAVGLAVAVLTRFMQLGVELMCAAVAWLLDRRQPRSPEPSASERPGPLRPGRTDSGAEGPPPAVYAGAGHAETLGLHGRS